MAFLFNEILVKPLLNLLVAGVNFIPGHDVGIVIILLTILVRLILAPSFHKSLKSQNSMTALQPKLDEIREKHKDNKEQQARATMQLYKEHKINPFSSCLPLIIQLPILFALYQVFTLGLEGKEIGHLLYNFVHNPGVINPKFLHLIDLSKPSLLLGIIAGVAQYAQSKMMLPSTASKDPTAKALSWQTVYIFPVLTVIISLRLPAGLPLFWITTTLFAVIQQYYIMRKNKVAT